MIHRLRDFAKHILMYEFKQLFVRQVDLLSGEGPFTLSLYALIYGIQR